MSPKGLEKVVRYFERVEDEMDPSWSDTQKCMYAYNCLAVDMNYGENSDNILSKGTAARGLNGILYGELVCPIMNATIKIKKIPMRTMWLSWMINIMGLM